MKIQHQLLIFISFLLPFSFSQASAGFVVGHNDTTLSSIPETWLIQAKSLLNIAYNHTSHGSQLITGIDALKDFPDFGNRYNWSETMNDGSTLSLADEGIPGTADLTRGNYVGSGDPDGVARWARDTYNYLINPTNNHINVIMWSWCSISGQDIPLYLDSMEWLIGLFSEGGSHSRASNSPVAFVFMTGHAEGDGEEDSSDSANALIRQHCQSRDRILYDFADIENYDPDNNYYLNRRVDDALYYDATPPFDSGSRDANWATDYLAKYPGGEAYRLVNGTSGYSGCGRCAHSPELGETADARLNCVLKGQATWSLFAQLAGWQPDGSGPPPPTPSPTPPATSANNSGSLLLLLSD